VAKKNPFDVAGTHCDHHVAGAGGILYGCRDSVKGLDEPDRHTARGDAASQFRGKLDLNWIVPMGHSCGGGLAIQLATEDARLKGLGIWYSGAGLAGAGGNDAASLQKIKGPVLLITGDEAHDIAFASGKTTFGIISHTPIFYAWQDELQHIGTFGAKDGGENGILARNWLEWTTRGDRKAAVMFKGGSCTLCKDVSWHVQKKRIDD